jgi:uncharacterized Ntn-hydrolase superfamily protein
MCHLSRSGWGNAISRLALALGLLVAANEMGWGQGSEGTIAVTVTDPTGAVVPGAKLHLVDLVTNNARDAVTQSGGTYSFVNLPLGTYRLTVSKEGFGEQAFQSIVVQAARVTDVNARL